MPFRASIASVLLLLLVAGCGSDQDAASGTTVTGPGVETATASVPETAPAIVTVYFLRDGKVGAASRMIVSGKAPATGAMIELLEGPSGPEQAAGLSTAIPRNIEWEGLSIAGGVAEITFRDQLDPEATAQVVYTLTQFPTVKKVSIGGEPAVGRVELEDLTPPVLVESPTFGQDVSSPLRIAGTANTFEATFNVEVLDDGGRVLGKRFVTATSGSGTRGTFDADVPFRATRNGAGMLVVFELSAEDGSRIHEIQIPLQIAP